MEELTLAESKKSTVAKSPAKTKSKTTKRVAKSTTTAKRASTKTAQSGKSKTSTKKLSINKSSDTTDQIVANAINMEQRQDMIAKTAYYLAEKRGFCGGNPTDDWLRAEQEVDSMLTGKNSGQIAEA